MSANAPVVVDASVLAKLFMEEQGTPAARALIGAGRALFGPQFVTIEVASAVVRRYRTGGLTRAEAERSLASVRRFFLHGAFALTPDADLQPRAEAIALELSHALKDCLYIALAEREGCDLITADGALLVRVAPLFQFVKPL